ncbi:MAG: thiamine pyrophosphate-dependent enzyme [Bacteroidales bacterium]
MDVKDIINPKNLIYEKPKLLTDKTMHYCPGCSHGVAHKLLAQILEERDLQEKAIGVAPVGCAVFAYKYIDIDWHEAAHGRAPAVATGIARVMPDRFVFTYQGDGDLASIGAGEIIHAANRGENMLVIFINNAIYGMTGGQLAPTTLLGQVTSTSPTGREVDLSGYPLKMSDLLALLPGTCYVTRQAVHTAGAAKKCKRAIDKGVEKVLNKKGMAVIEVVSTCSSGWRMTPDESNKWMEENMFPVFPLGDLKDGEKGV